METVSPPPNFLRKSQPVNSEPYIHSDLNNSRPTYEPVSSSIISPASLRLFYISFRYSFLFIPPTISKLSSRKPSAFGDDSWAPSKGRDPKLRVFLVQILLSDLPSWESEVVLHSSSEWKRQWKRACLGLGHCAISANRVKYSSVKACKSEPFPRVLVS